MIGEGGVVSKKYSCLAARASACGRVTGLLFCLVLFGFFFFQKILLGELQNIYSTKFTVSHNL